MSTIRPRAAGAGRGARPAVHPGGRAPRREQVYRLLERSGRAVTAAELAAELEVHVNTVRFHIGALIDAGRVESSSPGTSGPGRPALVYRAVPGMDPNGPRAYRHLASVFVDDLREAPDGVERARRLGRSWGERLAREEPDPHPAELSARLRDLLADVGFEPGPPEEGAGREQRIVVHNCPFLEFTSDRASIVCAIHLGMMEGAFGSWRAGPRPVRLVPFATPETCLVEVGPDMRTEAGTEAGTEGLPAPAARPAPGRSAASADPA